jgi:hypothetical protein
LEVGPVGLVELDSQHRVPVGLRRHAALVYTVRASMLR